MPTTITGSTGVSQVQDGVVDADALATLTKPLGVGQTWQNFFGSRSLGTSYTNDTGRPIVVSVWGTGGAAADRFVSITIDGVKVEEQAWSANGDGNIRASASAIVPAGAVYVVVGTGTLEAWVELR
jgi:hypothetical protein